MSLGFFGSTAWRHGAACALALCCAALASTAGAQAPPAPEQSVFGVWRNPKESVHVDIRPCGPYACGVVVWASEEAEEKVRKATGKRLLGLELFQKMVRASAGVWRGRAYAPDLDITFTGSAEVTDPTTLRAKGCLVRLILCRSQVWKRIDPPPE